MTAMMAMPTMNIFVVVVQNFLSVSRNQKISILPKPRQNKAKATERCTSPMLLRLFQLDPLCAMALGGSSFRGCGCFWGFLGALGV